ncbi:YdcH family protein [Azospirillum sp. sgz301742]
MLQRHDLEGEFPEHRGKLESIRAADERFRTLEHEYAGLDKEILTAEENGIPLTDEHFTALKRRRLALKEQLESLLKAWQPA